MKGKIIMSKCTYYAQCRLQKGNQETIAFIPDKFAKEGKFIKLIDDDGWKVTSIGVKLDANYVEEREMDYKSQRKASDI